MRIPIVSFDPSLRNWGAVKATLDTDTLEVQITEMEVTDTSEAMSTLKTVRQNSQDLASSELLHEGMIKMAAGARLAFAEVPVGSQSARAMASYGICVGVLGGCPVPLIQVTPTEVKKAAVGHGTATKEEMIAWAVAKHPDAPWPRNGKGTIIAGKAEHLADATAAIYAGMLTPTFKSALAMLVSFNKE